MRRTLLVRKTRGYSAAISLQRPIISLTNTTMTEKDQSLLLLRLNASYEDAENLYRAALLSIGAGSLVPI
jgi:hypothetical protein